MGRLDGKVALISGGARGMGAAEARLFAEEGASVAVGDVLDVELGAVAEAIGDRALALPLDVTHEEDWASAVAATTDHFGRLDILVNNAGIAGQGMPFAQMPIEEYMRVIGVNQVGVFLGMRAVVPSMIQAGGGSIINISSIAGLQGQPFTLPYCASKFAVRGMTKVAALELGSSGIRVNSIHPGVINTDMTAPANTAGLRVEEWYGVAKLPAGRAGEADDVARVALFLASDDSAYCTGAEFVVDGGQTCGIGVPVDRFGL